MANEARWTELVIIISYPTSARGIIALLKTPQNIYILLYVLVCSIAEYFLLVVTYFDEPVR